MRRIGALLVAGAIATACGGGPGTSGEPAASNGGTLTYALESELRTLDPLSSTQPVERTVMYQMYESLVSVDEKLNVRPRLARSWTVSPDGLTYTFQLQPGVRFQDGTDLNGAAVKFNLDRILGTASSPRRSELASIQSVDAPAAGTVVLHLKNADAALLAQLADRAGMVLSPAAVQKAGAALGAAPIGAGTGPFAFGEWKRDDHLTIRRNPDYWGVKAHLDQVVYRPILNDDARTTGLETGDFDMLRLLPGKDVASVKADASLVYREVPGTGFGGIELNHAKPPFNDKARAQAVAQAVDRAQILKNAFSGAGAVSHGPIPPSSWAYDASQKIYDRPDPVRARATSTGFTFSLKVPSDPDLSGEAALIKDQLSRAGITVTLQTEPLSQVLAETASGSFEAALAGSPGGVDPDGNLYSRFHTGGGDNRGAYSNPQVDKALEDARTTIDQARRKQLYAQAQRLLVEDAAYVFIHHPPAAEIASRKVHGYTLYPDGIPRLAGVWKG